MAEKILVILSYRKLGETEARKTSFILDRTMKLKDFVRISCEKFKKPSNSVVEFTSFRGEECNNLLQAQAWERLIPESTGFFSMFQRKEKIIELLVAFNSPPTADGAPGDTSTTIAPTPDAEAPVEAGPCEAEHHPHTLRDAVDCLALVSALRYKVNSENVKDLQPQYNDLPHTLSVNDIQYCKTTDAYTWPGCPFAIVARASADVEDVARQIQDIELLRLYPDGVPPPQQHSLNAVATDQVIDAADPQPTTVKPIPIKDEYNDMAAKMCQPALLYAFDSPNKQVIGQVQRLEGDDKLSMVDFSSPSEFHQGFFNIAMRIPVAPMVEYLKHNPESRLILTGHSYGGSVAVALGLVLLHKYGVLPARLSVMTFGMSAVGTGVLRKLVKDRGWAPVFSTFLHDDDLVPIVSRLAYTLRSHDNDEFSNHGLVMIDAAHDLENSRGFKISLDEEQLARHNLHRKCQKLLEFGIDLEMWTNDQKLDAKNKLFKQRLYVNVSPLVYRVVDDKALLDREVQFSMKTLVKSVEDTCREETKVINMDVYQKVLKTLIQPYSDIITTVRQAQARKQSDANKFFETIRNPSIQNVSIRVMTDYVRVSISGLRMGFVHTVRVVVNSSVTLKIMAANNKPCMPLFADYSNDCPEAAELIKIYTKAVSKDGTLVNRVDMKVSFTSSFEEAEKIPIVPNFWSGLILTPRESKVGSLNCDTLIRTVAVLATMDVPIQNTPQSPLSLTQDPKPQDPSIRALLESLASLTPAEYILQAMTLDVSMAPQIAGLLVCGVKDSATRKAVADVFYNAVADFNIRKGAVDNLKSQLAQLADLKRESPKEYEAKLATCLWLTLFLEVLMNAKKRISDEFIFNWLVAFAKKTWETFTTADFPAGLVTFELPTPDSSEDLFDQIYNLHSMQPKILVGDEHTARKLAALMETWKMADDFGTGNGATRSSAVVSVTSILDAFDHLRTATGIIHKPTPENEDVIALNTNMSAWYQNLVVAALSPTVAMLESKFRCRKNRANDPRLGLQQKIELVGKAVAYRMWSPFVFIMYALRGSKSPPLPAEGKESVEEVNKDEVVMVEEARTESGAYRLTQKWLSDVLDKLLVTGLNVDGYEQKLRLLYASMDLKELHSQGKNPQYDHMHAAVSIERLLSTIELLQKIDPKDKDIPQGTIDVVYKKLLREDDGSALLVDYREITLRWARAAIILTALRDKITFSSGVGFIGTRKVGKSTAVRRIWGMKNVVVGPSAAEATVRVSAYCDEYLTGGLRIIDYPGLNEPRADVARASAIAASLSSVLVLVADYSHSGSELKKIRELLPEKTPILLCFNRADDIAKTAPQNNVPASGLRDYIGQHYKNRLQEGKQMLGHVFEISEQTCWLTSLAPDSKPDQDLTPDKATELYRLGIMNENHVFLWACTALLSQGEHVDKIRRALRRRGSLELTFQQQADPFQGSQLQTTDWPFELSDAPERKLSLYEQWSTMCYGLPIYAQQMHQLAKAFLQSYGSSTTTRRWFYVGQPTTRYSLSELNGHKDVQQWEEYLRKIGSDNQGDLLCALALAYMYNCQLRVLNELESDRQECRPIQFHISTSTSLGEMGSNSRRSRGLLLFDTTSTTSATSTPPVEPLQVSDSLALPRDVVVVVTKDGIDLKLVEPAAAL